MKGRLRIRGGRLRIFSLLLLFVVLAQFVCANESDTALNIPNTPPVFSGLIPNFTVDGALLNAFDLDDYFEDLQGDTLNYTFSGNVNVAVSIDENNIVSFSIIGGFVGVESVQFFASDGEFTVESNIVYLGAGVDLTPPTWYNPTKSKDKVYAGEAIYFNALWKDNLGLGRYFTEIDFGYGWEKYNGTFSGKQNVSNSQINISAPVGKIVPWRICGFDFSENFNCTDIYEFTVLKTPSIPGGEGTVGTGGGTGDVEGEGGEGVITGESIKDLYEDSRDLIGENTEDFTIDVDSFLVKLMQGTSKTMAFEIVNTGMEDLNFDLILSGVGDYVIVGEESFVLEAGSSKTITMDFSAKLTDLPGQYFGELRVVSSEEVVLPIVLEINPAELVFSVNVETLSESVKPGKQISAMLNLTNNGDVILSDVNLYYAVKDFYGNIYDFGEEVVSFDKQMIVEKSLTVPEDVLLGKYIFYARISNEKDIAINSDTFMVGLAFIFEAFLNASVSFIAVILLSIIAIILVMRHRKQKEKEKALNLYVKLIELKELIKDDKFEQAANLYMSVKKIYGEPIPGELLENKEKLIASMKELAGRVNFDEVAEDTEGSEEGEGASEESSDGEGDSVESKSTENSKATESVEVVSKENAEGESTVKEEKESSDKPTESEGNSLNEIPEKSEAEDENVDGAITNEKESDKKDEKKSSVKVTKKKTTRKKVAKKKVVKKKIVKKKVVKKKGVKKK